MNKWFYIIAVLGIAAIAGWFIWGRGGETEPQPQSVMSFEDCARAGYPVMESFPRQCRTPDGRVFAEELPPPQVIYNNASSDLVKVELPAPGAVVGKEFSVIGQARGNWFFEASFPVEVLGQNGQRLAAGVAQAQGEWMTTSFVPFRADLQVPQSYIGPATLVLHKDNPSGLPQNDASVSFPITIEY